MASDLGTAEDGRLLARLLALLVEMVAAKARAGGADPGLAAINEWVRRLTLQAPELVQQDASGFV